MSAPTIHQLCHQAKTGPWKATGGTVRVDSPNRYEQEKVCSVPSPAGAAPEAWEAIDNKRQATAQLIARLSPDVVLKVVEALERALQDMVCEHKISGGHGHNETDNIQLVRESIQLLNGQPPAKL